MFLKNAWYCAGWQSALSVGRTAILSRKIADEDIMLYRKLDGSVVALEDRCPHRQAPLSLGRKEGDSIRCMYHGWKFSEQGECIDIPGLPQAPGKTCARALPAVVKNDWIWVWMGDPAKADASLICESVGPGNPDWEVLTSYVEVNTNYRLEMANLNDLSHVAWVHMDTFGGTTKYSEARGTHVVTPRGLDTEIWLHGVPAPRFAQHLFPADMLFDLHFAVAFTVPCNFNMKFRVYSAGTATEGPSNGELVLDTYTSQAITPRDEDWVDYYYAWGAVKGSVPDGYVSLLKEAIDEAFLEDKQILEGQHKRMKAKPDFKMADYQHDGGPAKMFWVLDKLIKEENETVS